MSTSTDSIDPLLEAIRAATSQDASTEARDAGVAACRTLLTALEAKPGEPLAATAAEPVNAVAQLVGTLRGVPVDQLLNLAIARLRAALPAGTPAPTVAPLRFQVVPIAQVSKGAKP